MKAIVGFTSESGRVFASPNEAIVDDLTHHVCKNSTFKPDLVREVLGIVFNVDGELALESFMAARGWKFVGSEPILSNKMSVSMR